MIILVCLNIERRVKLGVFRFVSILNNIRRYSTLEDLPVLRNNNIYISKLLKSRPNSIAKFGVSCGLVIRSQSTLVRIKYSMAPGKPVWNLKMEEEPMMFVRQAHSGKPLSKVTVVGSGQVGMACAFSLVSQGITNEIALVDVFKDKLTGEVMDLQQGAAFTPSVKVYGSTDYAVTKDSKICIITAGARQKEGETRLQLIEKNVQILKQVVPELLKYSPNAILMLVTNPVDVLTYCAWRISGRPVGTVIGTGTSLDTGRLKFLIAEKIDISPKNIHIWIIGEHGDNSVPVWSRLQVGGVNIQELNHPSGIKDPKSLDELHTAVVNSAYDIIRLKGYTSWAIGLNVADICRSILHNSRRIHAVSTLVKGFHGVEDEVFASLPCVLDTNGISRIINLKINNDEEEKFTQATKTLYKIQLSTGL
uniref:L-lactate dehydrogenase n=2 Tax=Lygus hesperus TaxID=30085 RepID=A0A0A9WYS0_LYGHE